MYIRMCKFMWLHVQEFTAMTYTGRHTCTCTCRLSYKVLTTVVTVVFLVVFHWCSCLECHVHVP